MAKRHVGPLLRVAVLADGALALELTGCSVFADGTWLINFDLVGVQTLGRDLRVNYGLGSFIGARANGPRIIVFQLVHLTLLMLEALYLERFIQE